VTSTTPSTPATREVLLASAVAVAIFHAIEIFFERSVRQPLSSVNSSAVSTSLAALLKAAKKAYEHRGMATTVTFDHFQWALFIGAVETEDALHRDWIMDRMSDARLKAVLQGVETAKEGNGGVISYDVVKLLFHMGDETSTQIRFDDYPQNVPEF
jgi:hypothetical protein